MPETIKPIETIEEYEDAKKRLTAAQGGDREALVAAVKKWEADHGAMPKAIRPAGLN
jgi:hypothetical protein